MRKQLFNLTEKLLCAKQVEKFVDTMETMDAANFIAPAVYLMFFPPIVLVYFLRRFLLQNGDIFFYSRSTEQSKKVGILMKKLKFSFLNDDLKIFSETKFTTINSIDRIQF